MLVHYEHLVGISILKMGSGFLGFGFAALNLGMTKRLDLFIWVLRSSRVSVSVYLFCRLLVQYLDLVFEFFVIWD